MPTELVPKIAVVEQFVREISGGAYSPVEEQMVWVLEDGSERGLWLGTKPETVEEESA